jgi:hypothetical protein
MPWSERARRRGGAPQEPAKAAPGMQLDPVRRRWLEGLLAACEKSGRLNSWEITFTASIGSRLAIEGDRMVLTEKQFGVLWKIEEKVHAAG